MPVTINLFSELQSEAGAQQRDLFLTAKKTLLGCIVAGVVLVALSWLYARMAQSRLKHATLEWEKVGDTYDELILLNNRGATLGARASFLADRVRKRVIWAPVLARVADMVPEDTQITKLTCERRLVEIKPDPATLVGKDGHPPSTKAELDELIRKNTRVARAPRIFIEGLAYGQRAELTVDAFRRQLQDFSLGEDFQISVRLGALGAARTGVGADSAEVKRFIIDCDFQEIDHGGA